MSMSIILAILMSIESGGQPNPATCVGDNGRAIGILQIHKLVVVDVNKAYGTRYVWPDDCKDPVKSKDIATKYLTLHGKGKSPEELARIWNGGPKGYLFNKNPKTEARLKKYEEKFRERARRFQVRGKL
jgi:soluble lytic murein transglycosylase-like protein